MTEKELKELEKFAKENGYNDELKDIYLRHAHWLYLHGNAFSRIALS